MPQQLHEQDPLAGDVDRWVDPLETRSEAQEAYDDGVANRLQMSGDADTDDYWDEHDEQFGHDDSEQGDGHEDDRTPEEVLALSWLRDAARDINGRPELDHGRVNAKAIGEAAINPFVMPDHIRNGTQLDQQTWKAEMHDYERPTYRYPSIKEQEADARKNRYEEVLWDEDGVFDTINHITGTEVYDMRGNVTTWSDEDRTAAIHEFFDLEKERQKLIAEGADDPLKDQIETQFSV